MFAKGVSLALLLVVGSAAPLPAEQPSDRPAQLQWAQQCKDWDDWAKPAPPFRVFGNTGYVGSCGISAILVTGPRGNVLIDGGPAESADLVAANIEKLGFRLADVKIILNTHEHNDHVGAIARLKQLTGARLFASPAGAKAFESGGPTPDDPQFASHAPIPKVAVDRVLQGNASVALGTLTLVATPTPGHTPGALSWTWQSCEGRHCQQIVYADSLSPVSSDGYRFSDHPAYLRAYRQSLGRVARFKCDILLSPHPSASGMRDKLVKGDLAGPPRCQAYAEQIGKRLDERLAKEAHGG
jgi:metallo-beta-lactamase class B